MQIELMEILTGGIAILPLLLIFTFMPYLTRRDICFGIRIPPAKWNDEYLRKLRLKHSAIVGIIGIILLAASIFSIAKMNDMKAQWMMIGILVGYLAIYSIIYIASWQYTKEYKEKMDWETEATAIATADTNKSIKTRTINPLLYIVYPIIIGATYFASLEWYKDAPDILPMQYDFSGNVTNSVPKDMSVIYQFIGIQVVMFILFFGINLLISRAKEDYDPSNPEKSAKQYSTMKIRWANYLYIMGIVMLLMFSFAVYSVLNPVNTTLITLVPMVTTMLIVIGAIVLSIKTGQSGSHIDADNENLSEKINRSDDEYWKLGSFYFNPDDPAIFVDKRHGIGWTNNWARWQSWVVIIIVFGLILYSALELS